LPLALLFAPPFARAAEPVPASDRCIDRFAAGARLVDRTITLAGSSESRIDLPDLRRQDALVYAMERGVDVELELHEASGALIVTADSPVARSGIQRVWVAGAGRVTSHIILRGREHAGVSGQVHVLVVQAPASSECVALEKNLGSADVAYASARASAKREGAPRSPRAMLESAASQYEKATASFESTRRSAEQGEVELALAALNYYELQDWGGSAVWAQRAASTLQKAGSEYSHARAQAILAAAWLELATKSSSSGQSASTPAASRSLLDRARALLARLERFHAARNEPYDRALQVNNIGLAHLYEARFELGIAQFTQALAAFERLGETQRVAVALQNIALCEWGLGRLSAALPRFDRALSLMSPQPYPDLYLATLDSSALAHHAAGQLDAALRLHGQALDIATRLQLDRARARSYLGMGVTYYAIGDRDLATRFLGSALETMTPDTDARGRVTALRALAVIEQEEGRHAQAAAHDSEALRLATAPSARSRILLRLATDYAAQGDLVAALGLLDSLAAFAPNGDALVQAMARAQRGKLRRAAGTLDLARADISAAIATLRQFEALPDEFDALVELARIENEAGREDAALSTLSDALRLTGELMAQTANPVYRASIAQSVRPALDLKIDLLWRRYERLMSERRTEPARIAMLEGLRTADDSRAMSFEQFRAQQLDRPSDPHMAELQRTVSSLYRDIAERRSQLSAREDGRGANDPAAKALREDISRLRARLGVANTELASRAAPHASRGALPVSASIDRLLSASAEKAFVEYWVGRTNAYAWTIARGQVSWVRLASSEQIERSARALHDSMRSYATVPVRNRLEHSARLHQLVIAPLRDPLAGTSDITIVPDGPLHYVPFAALRDTSITDRPYIAQRFAVAFAPALRLMSRPAAARPAHWTNSRMLMVADPVYQEDDARLLRAGPSRVESSGLLNNLFRTRGGVDPKTLERLISSAQEAERIRALPGLRRVDVLEGLNATRANVLAQNLAQYRFIHFASHGIIDSEIPQLSALILGAWDRNGPVTDQYVRAGDLLALTFDAEVVVLSACDTALGREFAGEGLMGLRYAALARGARSVVGSLWPVSDAIAAELMTDMYRYITVDGQTVGRALNAAIRAKLSRSAALDPALWGPFAVYVADD